MSTASLTVAALAELGIPHEKVKLDLSKKETKKPEFLAINPNGTVPAMVDDGVAIFESLAILIHLGEKYGVAKNLWPAVGSPEHARALSWSTWCSVTMMATGWRLMQNTAKDVPAEAKNEVQARNGREEFNRAMDILEGQLSKTPFIVGEKFTLVDSHLSVTFGWLYRSLEIDVSKYPRLSAWMKTCESRPAMAAVMEG